MGGPGLQISGLDKKSFGTGASTAWTWPCRGAKSSASSAERRRQDHGHEHRHGAAGARAGGEVSALGVSDERAPARHSHAHRIPRGEAPGLCGDVGAGLPDSLREGCMRRVPRRRARGERAGAGPGGRMPTGRRLAGRNRAACSSEACGVARVLLQDPSSRFRTSRPWGLTRPACRDADIFRELRDQGLTLLFSSAPVAEDGAHLRRGSVLSGGRVVARGPPEDLLPAAGGGEGLRVETFEAIGPAYGHRSGDISGGRGRRRRGPTWRRSCGGRMSAQRRRDAARDVLPAR